MDTQILRDLFSQCIEASRILKIDHQFAKKLVSARDRLAPMQIGKAGQLQEWLEDWDLEAPERQHRHVSHLYGLFPSDQITNETPHLFAAAEEDSGIARRCRYRLESGMENSLLGQTTRRRSRSQTPYQGADACLSKRRGVWWRWWSLPKSLDAHPPFRSTGILEQRQALPKCCAIARGRNPFATCAAKDLAQRQC